MMLVLFGLQGNSEGDGSDGEDNTWPGRQEVGQPEDQIQGDKPSVSNRQGRVTLRRSRSYDVFRCVYSLLAAAVEGV